MKEFCEILESIATGLGGEWKDNVLIDNETDNPLVDAYNDGVNAMAKQGCHLVSVILGAVAAKMKDGVHNG